MSKSAPNAPTLTPLSGRVHIYFDDAEIVSSIKALKLEGGDAETRIFVPLEDVHPSILEASETTLEDEHLGVAHFYTIKTLTANGRDQAWYFPYAEGDYAPLRDLITFGGDRIAIKLTEV